MSEGMRTGYVSAMRTRGRRRGECRRARSQRAQAPRPSKRSFKEEREYAGLPERIAALEAEQQQLQAAIADPGFYKKPPAEIHAALERVSAIEGELLAALERWDALDSIGNP